MAPVQTGYMGNSLARGSVPPGLYAKAPLDLQVGPLFARDDIVRIGTDGRG